MAQIFKEAESYYTKSQYVNINSDPNASNGQITGNLGGSVEWVEYEITSPSSGTTDITAWVKRSSLADTNVTARLTVNGTNYDVQVPATSGIFPITFSNVAVPQGFSYFRFSGVTGQSYQLDKFGFEPIPNPMPSPLVDGYSNIIQVFADNFAMADLYSDFGYKCQIYKDGQPFILAELYQEPVLDENGDAIDYNQVENWSPQPSGYFVSRGDDGIMELEVPSATGGGSYTFKLIPRESDTWHTSESTLSAAYVYTPPTPPPNTPVLSFDYGSNTLRYLSHPTKITSESAGNIVIEKYNDGNPFIPISTTAVQANQTISFNPLTTGVYYIKVVNENGSSNYATINYAYKGSDGYSLNGVVTGSGNLIPLATVGVPIQVSVPANGQTGIGEGYVFCLRNEADNSIEIINPDVASGDSFSFTKQSSGTFQAAMFYPTAPTNLTEWNNLRQNQYLVQVVAPTLPVPSISFDYGYATRYPSMPTIITSSQSGTINVYNGATLIDSFSITANVPYKYNPAWSIASGVTMTFKLSDGTNESAASSEVFYQVSSYNGFSVSPNSTSVGNVVTITIPSWDNAAPNNPVGEGLKLMIKKGLAGAKTLLFDNVSQGNTYQWTPTLADSNYRIFLEFGGAGGGSGTRVIVANAVSAAPSVITASPQTVGTDINGTGVSGAVVNVYKNGVLQTSVGVTNGSWSYTPTSDGVYTFSQTETGKTESAQTSSFTVNAALVAPNAPTITSSLNGQIGSLITGSIAEAGTILVFKDGTQIASLPNQSGSFSYSPQASGSYTFKLQNANGVSAASNTVLVPLTYEYEAIFTDTCGNPLEYSISQTISDITNPALVWQTSRFFQVLPSTQYNVHAREISTPSKGKSVVVTTLAN